MDSAKNWFSCAWTFCLQVAVLHPENNIKTVYTSWSWLNDLNIFSESTKLADDQYFMTHPINSLGLQLISSW